MSAAGHKRSGKSPVITKQAVVIIHGMGEQRPMETLRSFVETVYQRDLSLTKKKHQHDDPDLGHVNRVWIVPDRATGTVELRRITTPETKTNVRTDFFEFYWADIMQGTPLELITAWIKGLLLRSPARVPRRVPVWIAWIALWILAVLFVAFSIAILQPDAGLFPELVQKGVAWLRRVRAYLAIGLAVLGAVILGISIIENVIARLRDTRPIPRVKLVLPLMLIAAAALVYFVVPITMIDNPRLWAALLSGAAATVIGSVIVPYVGDVVRYVRANPATVAKREEVRKRGLALLRKLHAEKDSNGNPLYCRIVIVAHSLGSFVAYDLLQHLWEELGPNHKQTDPPSDEVVGALLAVDGFVKDYWCAPQSGDCPEFKLASYRDAQLAVFHALVKSNQGWRISDFVTLGSPIVHSEFLIADSRDQMARSFEERLLSSSPPRPDSPKQSMLYKTHDGRGPFAHFAAPFAAVRWTNIYDYSWFPLFGDIVSGPVPRAFGPGVADYRVCITRRGWPPVLRRFVTHTLYWAWQRGYKTDAPPCDPQCGAPGHVKCGGQCHIRLLRKALALNGLPPPGEGGAPA